ncbi:hypothetical protein BD311DRAFT_782968 [Dichomitus squalens]|uniref:Uncharacterized protein n=1 Tax=Dichomitus squalens TaxID=114155 RepID=A0A4Q9M6U3_9APHY|nr:hypothetical protein BD311DRAFT_782968 [Dichomitus squalens]
MLWRTQRQHRGQEIRARDLAVQYVEWVATGVKCKFDGVQQFAQLDVERGHADLGSWRSQGGKVSQDPAHAPMPVNIKFVTVTL